MKILVTGANGQLGYDLCGEIGCEAIGIDIKELDITNRSLTLEYIEKLRPDAIIHCAAYTSVDKAESEPEQCHAVNVLGTRHLAEAAKNICAKFLYISTDYVFDGTLDRPYEIDDATNPLNVYGRTKLKGEEAVRSILEKYFIVRISWVFGENGVNFVKTMLRLGRERGSVSVVANQFGSPAYTKDLAVLLAKMIRTDKYGVYHATNDGFCSWYDFTLEIFNLAGIDVSVKAIKTEEYPTAAVRPKNSRMSKNSLTEAGFDLLPTWQDALERFVTGINSNQT